MQRLTFIIQKLEALLKELKALEATGIFAPEYGALQAFEQQINVFHRHIHTATFEASGAQLQLNPQVVDLAANLQLLLSPLKSYLEQNGIHLTSQNQPAEQNILLDWPKTKLVLLDLFTYLIVHLPPGSKITIEFDPVPHSEAGHLHFRISAFSTGILPAYREIEHAFAGFRCWQQLVPENYHPAISYYELARAFISKQNGSLFVNLPASDILELEFVFPLAGSTNPANQKISEPPALAGLQKKDHNPGKLPSVLLVEDHFDVRYALSRYLQSFYIVLEAEDGLAGLKMARQLLPDLVVSDVVMPLVDGLEFCKQLKTDERTSHIPVILLTARNSSESRLRGLETGADDYIIKPFSAGELKARIQNLISQRRNLRERFAKDLAIRPAEITVTSTDMRFLQRAISAVESNMDNAAFDTSMLARDMNVSRSQLNRKLNALTDQTPREFVRMLRLKRAAQFLRNRTGNISEVAYSVGFNSLSYFAKAFKDLFGVLPSDYQGNGET